MAYPDVDDLKVELGISSSGDDAKLTGYVNGAIGIVEKETSRVFVAASAVRSFPCMSPHVDRSRRTLFTHSEFVAVTQLDIDGETIPTTQYYAESHNGVAPFSKIIIRRGSSYRFTDSDGLTDIDVTATWGYSADCPAALASVIIKLAAWMYRSNSTGSGGAVAAGSRRGGIVVEAAAIPADIMKVIKSFGRWY